jgi:DNA-binding NarL/FixJ family response regulator
MHLATFDPQGNRFPAFRRALDREADIVVVGNASTQEEALRQAQFCDVFLLLASPGDGKMLAVVHALHRVFPHVKLLVMCEQEDVDAIVRFVDAGASGYLLRTEPVTDQARKLRAAAENRALISPVVAARLLSHFAELAGQRRKSVDWEATDLSALTVREEEILSLLAEGLSNNQIGERLYVTVGTVKNHVHHILSKLNVTSRYEAAAAYLAMEGLPI